MERWQMSRLGFVNFWVYDEEEYAFEGGRLLLRGKNGSGKSITTQSSIPYLLDGDRSPYRLDPFGSKDRKMEYYLIGDNDSDINERTGYIWLEYIKPESKQYKTIGIGLRAKKGGTFNAWGFCLKDGKRIGYDFALYSEAGNQRIPHDAKTLKKYLGDENIFVEKVTGKNPEYKEMVAQEIFGISKSNIADYDRLTNVLIQTRSSKLSSKENMKPEQLYTVLNDSLQTLTDEDLRSMTEVMDSIENTRTKIEMDKQALREVGYIADEYDRYNRYMLWLKANAYLKKAQETNNKQRDAAKYSSEIEQAEQGILANTKLKEDAELQRDDLERERRSLDLSNIKEQTDRRNRSKEELKAQADARANKAERLGEKKAQQRRRYSNKLSIEKQLEGESHKKGLKLSEIREYKENSYPFYEYFYEELKGEKALQSEPYRKEIRDLKTNLGEAAEKLELRDKKHDEYDAAEEKLDKIKGSVDEKRSEAERARTQLNESKDSVIEDLYRAKQGNKELVYDELLLKRLVGIVSNYEGPGAANEFQSLILGNYNDRMSKLKDLIRELQGEENEKQLILDEAEERVRKLEETEEPTPERSESKKEAREILSNAGIEFRSFYECVDFKGSVPEDSRCAIEAELRDMGILDALVVRSEDEEKVKALLEGYTDSWLTGKNCDNARIGCFDVTVQDDFIDEVNAILARFSNETKLSDNGYYEHGVLSGYSVGETVRFIGAENRKRFRMQQLDEARALLDIAKEELKSVKSRLDGANKRQELLNTEYASRPDLSDIDAAVTLVYETERDLRLTEKEYDEQDKALKSCKQAWLAAAKDADDVCRDYPQYEKRLTVYREAIAGLDDFESIVCDIIDINKEIGHRNEQLISENNSISELENDIDEMMCDIRDIENRIHEHEEIIRICNDFLNRPENTDVSKQYDKLTELINDAVEKIREYDRNATEAKFTKAGAENRLREINDALVDLIADETKLAEVFAQELELGFVITDRSLTLDQSAKQAVKEVSEEDSRNEASIVQSRLESAFARHNTAVMADHKLMSEMIFKSGDGSVNSARRAITLNWQGSQVTPSEFRELIKNKIAEDELLMKEDEQELFKDILLNIISKKLCAKIDDSRRWVDKMSNIMKGINTSRGQSFSLSWRAKKDLGENELPFDELNKLLRMNKEMIRADDLERLTKHFRSKIEHEYRLVEERGEEANYSELIKKVLDYRNWFEFRLNFKEAGKDGFRELTASRFNSFSGGERAMSVYIPLFAAVAAQYDKSGPQAPRILALDEAFAGVDDSNISEMFALLEQLGFGYIINSQSLWGCYSTVPELGIAELEHEKDSDLITVIKYRWNGKKKALAE